VVPRAEFDHERRSLARSLANRPAGEIKRVIAGASPGDAVAAFARLWVSDEHWAAADRVMNRAR
jgi:enoyl-CoA hydratase